MVERRQNDNMLAYIVVIVLNEMHLTINFAPTMSVGRSGVVQHRSWNRLTENVIFHAIFRIQNIKLSSERHANNNNNNRNSRTISAIRHVREIISQAIFFLAFPFRFFACHEINNTRVLEMKPNFISFLLFLSVWVWWSQEICTIIKLSKVCLCVCVFVYTQLFYRHRQHTRKQQQRQEKIKIKNECQSWWSKRKKVRRNMTRTNDARHQNVYRYVWIVDTIIMYAYECLNVLTFLMTSAAAMPGYGVEPSVTISHIKMPKLQMSDFTEKILSYSDSIAIHL